jgi:hypothetical protein
MLVELKLGDQRQLGVRLVAWAEEQIDKSIAVKNLVQTSQKRPLANFASLAHLHIGYL